MSRLLACFFILSAGCAPRTAGPPLPTIADADRLATTGCYSCLLDALEIYERLLARRASPAVTRGAFRTALLLAVREKEVGLPWAAHLQRARELAASVPATTGHAALLLQVAAGLPPDGTAVGHEAYEEWIKTDRLAGPAIDEARRGLEPLLATDPLAAYLDIAVACSYGDFRQRDTTLDRVRGIHLASLLVKYRAGACAHQRRALLEEVLAHEPRYAEAHLFLGRYALADAAVGKGKRSEILPHLSAAYKAFPRSPSVSFTFAGMYRAFNRLKDALRYYDETLALVPTHREALLGRTIALSYTERPEDAMAAARRLIDLGEWYLGDAYYWLAFNQHALEKLDEARLDIERAKELAGIRSDVFLLSGIIYLEQRQLQEAGADLEKAWQLNDQSCDAAWYLGLVRAEQKQWGAAGDLFPKAAACYRANADAYRAELGVVQNTVAGSADADEVSTSYAGYIERELASEARAYYNAAYAAAQRGDKAQGIAFAERAAAHAIMKDKAAELIAALRR